MSAQHPKHALDSLIVMFEQLRESRRAASGCLLATSAVLEAITEEWPEIGERYDRIHSTSVATSPEAHAMREAVATIDRIIQETKATRGW